MKIEEGKAIKLKNGEEYMVLKHINHETGNYMLTLNLSNDSSFCLMELRENQVRLVNNSNFMAELIVTLLEDKEFAERFEAQITKLVNKE